MIARLTFAALDRLRSVPRSGWVGTVIGVAIGWAAVATLTKAPMDPPVAVGFALCVVITVLLCLTIGVLLVHIAEHDERLVYLETRGEKLPEVVEEPAGSDWYAKLKAGVVAVDARMRPTFLEPEIDEAPYCHRMGQTCTGVCPDCEDAYAHEPPATEPAPVVRPSPVPRNAKPGYIAVGQYDVPIEPLRFPEPEQPATTPMERAWEESAAELTEQELWEAEQEAKYAAAMARIEEMAKGVA